MKNEVIFVSGQRGSGKTYWTQHFATGLNRYLLYDTLGEYEGAHRFMDIESLLAYCRQAGNENFFEAIFDPPQHGDFPLFCELALTLGNLYVIVEELEVFATPYEISEEFARLIKHGRHYGVNVVGISRRPAEVSRLFTSQATRFILFKQIEPRDITYFKSIIGERAELLPRLNLYEFMDIAFDQEECHTCGKSIFDSYPHYHKIP